MNFIKNKRNSKLTPDMVRKIRKLAFEDGMTRKALAQRFSVAVNTIVKALHGHTWADVK